ncbi:MAG: tetratricopeptide repeat protein [Candidatus Latescibacteria bacterium]|nr:tetratricopeptide repeat protein [Candidatus Latescibacterota bacterium]
MDIPRRLTVAVASFLALHVLVAYWNPLNLWGIDALAYLPVWSRWAFAMVGALLLIPQARGLVLRLAAKTPSSLSPWRNRRSFRVASILFALLSLLAFVSLRSEAHLLGDGLRLVRELGASVWVHVPRLDRAPLAFWIVETLDDLVATIGGSADTTYRIYSCVSGLIYVLLSLQVARNVGTAALERTVSLGFLLTPGLVQLFFGYVENYALLLSGILLYLYQSCLVLQGRRSPWVPSALLGALVPLHFSAASLAPSLLVLVLHWHRSTHRAPGSLAQAAIARTLAQLGVAPIATLVVFGLIDFDVVGYLGDLRGSHFLTFSADPNLPHRYGLLSPDHLLDVLNQLLLVAPSALIVLSLAVWRSPASDPFRSFLLVTSAFPLLFTFVANPEIGAFRDWDVFAFAGLPLTLYGARILIDRIPDHGRLRHAGLLVCGAAALHSLAWVSVNADAASAEARFTHLLRHCNLSSGARSYGWETLGIRHYRGREPVRAVQAYKEAIAANPDNTRYHTNLGNLYLALGRFDDALAAHGQALRLAPGLGQIHMNLGAVYHKMGRYSDALEHYRRAIQQRPGLVGAHLNAGLAFRNLGQTDSARSHLTTVLQLDPNHAKAQAIRSWLEANP